MTKPEARTAGARCAADVASLLRARNPLIWCVTREEARAERLLVDAATSAGYVPRFWDCAEGITQLDGRAIDSRATDPAQALAAVRDGQAREVWILRDLHAWLRDPTVTRALRSLCRSLPMAPRETARAVVVLTPSAEVPPELAGQLGRNYPGATVRAADFLQLAPRDFGPFDRVLMNPPFERGADIVHIRHAFEMLAPGGLLVALCAAGPRQVAQLQPLADTWEALPEGTFAAQGTGVRVALLTMRKPAAD